jgi:hypothetical protein
VEFHWAGSQESELISFQQSGKNRDISRFLLVVCGNEQAKAEIKRKDL